MNRATQMDWRTLTVLPHRQQRRHHNRHVYGKLEPMDPKEDKWHWSAKLIVAVLAVPALIIWVTK